MQNTLQHGSYREKLFDKKWLIKRNAILRRDNNSCIICGKQDDLVVHHKQYHFVKNIAEFCDPWDYDDKYLVTLCESCHRRGHNKFNVPIKFI
jgi:5-methylcytosine-specific restriction endonuclease McrA